MRVANTIQIRRRKCLYIGVCRVHDKTLWQKKITKFREPSKMPLPKQSHITLIIYGCSSWTHGRRTFASSRWSRGTLPPCQDRCRWPWPSWQQTASSGLSSNAALEFQHLPYKFLTSIFSNIKLCLSRSSSPKLSLCRFYLCSFLPI